MRKSNHYTGTYCDPAIGPRQAAGASTALLHLLTLLLLVFSAAAQAPGTKEDRKQLQEPWRAKPAKHLWTSAQSISSSNIVQRLPWAPAPAGWGHVSTRPSTTSSTRRHLLSPAVALSRRLTADTSLPSSNVTGSSTNSTDSGSTDSSSSTAQITSSSGADDTSTDAAVGKPQNPWYDQHLPSGGGSWASGLLYGLFNTSGKLPLDAEGTADAEVVGAPVDPPPYSYPPVFRYPTVFFTLSLRKFADSSEGLGRSEQVALSAAINAFLAPSPNSVITNTTVITQALASNGLWVPCATAFLLSGSNQLQEFFAATLRTDPNLILPTATWGSVRTTNTKIAQPVAPASINYIWRTGEYSDCSVMCGGGAQQRDVSCWDSFGNPADASMCPSPQLSTSRSCQTQPCQAVTPTLFEIQLGEWGPCNATCGFGGQTRTASCVSKDGYIGTLDNCNTSPEDLLVSDALRLWKPCDDLPPCEQYIWSYGDWLCDNTRGCGGGTAGRNVSCIVSSSGKAVADSKCTSPPDNTTQPCATPKCIDYYWKARELADCKPEDGSKPCGRYLQRRGFDCVDMSTGEVVTNNNCLGREADAKPTPLGEVECTRPADIDCSPGAAPPSRPLPAAPETVTSLGVEEQPSPAPEPTAPAPDSPPKGIEKPQPEDMSFHSAEADSQQQAGTPAFGEDPPDSNGVVAGGSPTGVPNAAAAAGSSGNAPQQTETNPDSTGSSGLDMDIRGDAGGGAQGAAAGDSPGNSTGTAGTAPSSGVDSTGADAKYDSSSDSSDSSSTTASAIPTTTSSSSGGGSNGGGILVSVDLGPEPSVPTWLLNDPTPALKTLLECTGGYALSADGKCCSGSLVDVEGKCCEAGSVDACGRCVPPGDVPGKVVDSLGVCCKGVLDARGVCCDNVVDECGVCNGTNTCDLKADLIAVVAPASASSYLVPASNANRRLRAALQEDIAAAVSLAGGRTLEKGRVAVVMSVYNVPGIEGVISASEGWDDYGQQDPSSTGDSSDGAPVTAALPRGTDGSTGSMPVQMVAVIQAPEQLDAPATHANLAAQTPPSGSNLELFQRQLERASHILQGTGSTQEAAGVASDGKSSSAAGAAVNGGVLRRLRHTAVTVPGKHSVRVRALTQAGSGDNGVVDTVASIRLSVSLKAPSSGTGLDTGTALLALTGLVGNQLDIDGRNRLTYKQVLSVVRTGTCGDGICQVNERISANNPDSCQTDCTLPFLSCPPFNSNAKPCNGLGVCYNSVGQCACTKGYSGTDCSSCAVGFKRLNGFCVASVVIAPKRMLGVNDGSLLAVVPPPRSMEGGRSAVLGVIFGSMAFVLLGILVQRRVRHKAFLKEYREDVERQARRAA